MTSHIYSKKSIQLDFILFFFVIMCIFFFLVSIFVQAMLNEDELKARSEKKR